MNKEDVGLAIEKLNENGVVAEIVEIAKNNGVIYEGIRLGSNIVQPVIYPQTFKSIDELVDFAMKTMEKAEEHTALYSEKFENVKDYEKMKEHLAVKLTSNPNKAWVYKKAFEDLYLSVYAVLDETCSMNITKEIVEVWEVSEDEVCEFALANSEKILPAKLNKLSDVIEKLSDGKISGESPLPLMVLTNDSGIQGASAILYAKDLPDEFIMFPSSVHEVIFMTGDRIDEMIAKFKEENIVKEINEKVNPVDILSDHVYVYRKGVWSSL